MAYWLNDNGRELWNYNSRLMHLHVIRRLFYCADLNKRGFSGKIRLTGGDSESASAV